MSCLPLDRIQSANGTPQNQLNLFLWKVSPNPGWVNERLPSRSPAGDRLANPYLALDLHYLLTAIGSADLHAEILLGYAMQIMHETPVLTRDAIRRSLGTGTVVTGQILPQPQQTLVAADLADQVEGIKITPYAADTEETSKLWSALNTSLRLTAMYHVSVVLIESQASTRSALPVRESHTRLATIRRPSVSRILLRPSVSEPPVEHGTIVPGARIDILGSSLAGDIVRVRVDDLEITPSPADVGDEQISMVLPTSLHPGIKGVQVLHLFEGASPADLRPWEQSNLAAVVVSPEIDTDASGNPIITMTGTADENGLIDGTITVHFSHMVGVAQRASLSLNELNAPADRRPRAYGFDAQRPADPTAPPTEVNQLNFDIAAVAPGPYLVRVRIEGAETALELGASGYDGPALQVEASP